ncbi:MAG TPA: hypothetical protein PKD37_03680 [Oligoflexia bacterium]|nr:hypothetical protein [Oligoflexia bacterium]HMP27068.1 hypothetical protein [Oligoflexia bacterium]
MADKTAWDRFARKFEERCAPKKEGKNELLPLDVARRERLGGYM